MKEFTTADIKAHRKVEGRSTARVDIEQELSGTAFPDGGRKGNAIQALCLSAYFHVSQIDRPFEGIRENGIASTRLYIGSDGNSRFQTNAVQPQGYAKSQVVCQLLILFLRECRNAACRQGQDQKQSEDFFMG